jgi:predicted dehydrogenase/threonine dehydrogenase-like Zn-dependent dehydrogenase
MPQLIQNLKSGKVELKEVPTPGCGASEVLVATQASLISAGTERMVMDFAGKSLVGKAKERPDLVKKVVAKMQRDGVASTLQGVFLRLDEPLPLGYSAAGEVVAVGSNLQNEFKVGDKVAIAGAGLANHASFNAVPRNLAVKVPENVPVTEACYATLGAIALHGVRNADVKLGERVLVIGLGLVGQLAVQLAHAAGARVAAIDFNADRASLAKLGGASWAGSPSEMADTWQTFTDNRGFDAILLCAATESDGPLQQAADWARDRANVVLVGKVGTKFDYATFMKKELNIRVSRSYGPGRYDPAYEQQGLSYPAGFVPHTERDNLATVIHLMSTGALRPHILTTHTFKFEEALKGYDLIQQGAAQSLGVVLSYPQAKSKPTLTLKAAPTLRKKGTIGVSFIGTGGFVRSVVLPALQGLRNWSLQGVVSKGGLSAAHVAERYNAAFAGTDLDAIWNDPQTDAVFIGTRHNQHAAQTIAALQAGKHVWVEKPLALTLKDITAIEKAHTGSGRVLMVGFNRRFSPALVPLKAKLDSMTGPKTILVRVNAGKLEGDSWQNGREGGGRLLGEAVHFTDMAYWLAGTEPETTTVQRGAGQDNYTISMTFPDGSLATIIYSSEGDPAAPKERVEVMCGGASGVMDNYMSTVWTQNTKRQTLYKKPWYSGQQKGHKQALAAWLSAIHGQSEPPIPASDLFTSSRLLLESA